MSPHQVLVRYGADNELSCSSEEFAKYLDSVDNLKDIRNEFHIPKNRMLPEVDLSLVDGDEDCVYLCGHSLGLCPKATEQIVCNELKKWKESGVLGHFMGKYPWAPIGEAKLTEMAKIVGAKPNEVAIMNSLTVNLQLLLVAFYKPTKTRNKILMEQHCFISDDVAIESHLKVHGYTRENIIFLKPRKGEETLRKEDIINLIEREGDTIATILIGGMQYYTGQKFDMKAITEAGHKMGCKVGFDLAHAVGNIELELHNWNVDFACWCSYKYMNSGPGAIAGIFVHEKYDGDTTLTHFSGWWSVDQDKRFEMDGEKPILPGAKGFAMSNPSVMSMMPLIGSLDIFERVGMKNIVKKQSLLTGYLEFLIKSHFHSNVVSIITPDNPEERGCQLSLKFNKSPEEVIKGLSKRGVVCDFRRPYVMRVAPVPLYNSFMDVYKFVQYLTDSLLKKSK